MMSLEEFITQLKAGQLSSEVQTYLIQTGIPKVVHIFLKEGYVIDISNLIIPRIVILLCYFIMLFYYVFWIFLKEGYEKYFL